MATLLTHVRVLQVFINRSLARTSDSKAVCILPQIASCCLALDMRSFLLKEPHATYCFQQCCDSFLIRMRYSIASLCPHMVHPTSSPASRISVSSCMAIKCRCMVPTNPPACIESMLCLHATHISQLQGSLTCQDPQGQHSCCLRVLQPSSMCQRFDHCIIIMHPVVLQEAAQSLASLPVSVLHGAACALGLHRLHRCAQTIINTINLQHEGVHQRLLGSI